MGQRSLLLLLLLALLTLKLLLRPPLLLWLLGAHVLRPLLLLRSRPLREPGCRRMHSPLLLLWLQLLSLLGGVGIGWLLLLVAVPGVKDALGFRL